MEHALGFHIRKNFDKAPTRYAKLSERLDEILKTLTGKWDQLSLAELATSDQLPGELRIDIVHLAEDIVAGALTSGKHLISNGAIESIRIG